MATGRVPTTANSPLTAKGDLFTYSTAPARLAVGNSGEQLVADSAATTGLRYNPPVGSLANPVINGGMDNWQRGTSIAVTASTTPYTADRWQVTNGANQALTVSRQATGDTTNLPNIQYAARVQRNSGQTGTSAISLVQSFETINSIPFAGKAVTVSFYARKGADYSSSGSSLAIDFISGTGTDQNRATAGYTGNANVISNGATLTTTWQRFSYTGTVGATATELATYFYFTPTGTAGTNDYFELTGVQVDVGTWTATTAPTFRRSGGTIQGELAACQRYFETSYDAGTAPGAATETGMVGNYWNLSTNQTGYMGQNVLYKVSKRMTAPTITIYDAAGTSGKMAVHQSSGANVNNVAYTGTVQNGMSGFTLYTSGYASGMAGFNFHFTSSAEL
jgi:hypothetical protein